ncbi:hypothetical protein A5893_03050 [Pedobacter psychrophilus]|uniref:Uncharacterized protein n=1 Tax=Pedobacter psychrophilus TaxID=1826909 RepID=A0A179DM32_9SPHI|nr:hypothetical protein [Pedobacter psychrophilus]OAQ42107.1 hypothetical protein A5893_03050 [Pedobacter psychrophilus]
MQKTNELIFILKHFIFGYQDGLISFKEYNPNLACDLNTELDFRLKSYKSLLKTHSIDKLDSLLRDVINEIENIDVNNQELRKRIAGKFRFIFSHKTFNQLNGIESNETEIDLDSDLSLVFLQVDGFINKVKINLNRLLNELNHFFDSVPLITEPQRLRIELSKYGFMELDKVNNFKNKNKIFELLAIRNCSLQIATLQYFDFIQHVNLKFAKGVSKELANIISEIMKLEKTDVLNNINALNSGSKVERTRYKSREYLMKIDNHIIDG